MSEPEVNDQPDPEEIPAAELLAQGGAVAEAVEELFLDDPEARFFVIPV